MRYLVIVTAYVSGGDNGTRRSDICLPPLLNVRRRVHQYLSFLPTALVPALDGSGPSGQINPIQATTRDAAGIKINKKSTRT